MKRTAGIVALAVVGVALAVGGGTYALHAARKPGSVPALLAPPPRDPYRAEIVAAQATAAARPRDPAAWADLAVREVEGVRRGGDPSGYSRADVAVAQALRLDRSDPAALRAGAVLANGRHSFDKALVMAQRAVDANPTAAASYGPLTDALVELGRYDEAGRAAQAMVDRRPNLASYARVSYLRELQGDPAGATQAMTAAQGAAGSPAEQSFTTLQLGELAWQQGRIDDAARLYQQAEQLDPHNLAASAGTARILAAHGDLPAAITTFRRLVDQQPQPGLLIELADLQVAADRVDDAIRTDDLLDAQRRLFEANGVDLDLELSVHSADRRTNLQHGLDQARTAYRHRPSVFAADALAWQLMANAQPDEALRYADEALRFNTPRASFHWHRAQIRKTLGDQTGADSDIRALAHLNPIFSPVYAPAIRAAMNQAGSS